jgi:N-acetylglucosamine kinase-like BadF-type ATPase
LFLGIDGGGTKTTFVLLDRNGTIRATHPGGCAYYLEVGMEPLRTMINDGIRALLRTAGADIAAVEYAFLGLPVHGQDEHTAELDRLPVSTLTEGRYACGNDMVCGWAGSLACEDGINVVAGTGSNCYGVYAGRSARCGGWGPLFSDEGSAYWIAISGLRLFSRMSDGRAERGPLYELIRQLLGARRDIELDAWVQTQMNLGRSHVAELSRLVRQAEEQGDAQARRVFALASQELAELVVATRRALAIPARERVLVSYSGGVFSIGALVTAPFKAALEASGEPYAITKPRFTPAIGAALYAARLAGQPLSEAALARLAQQPSARPLSD